MLSALKGVGPVTEKKLHALGIYSPEDLIERVPKGYMDLSVISRPQDTADGDFCLFDGDVYQITKPYKKGKTEFFKAYVLCDYYKITLTWFNQNYASKNLEKGKKYRFYGKLKIEKNGLNIYNPLYEETDDIKSLFGVRPIYWTKGLIPQKSYRALVAEAFLLVKELPSILGEKAEREYDIMPLKEAYYALHFPETTENRRAKERVTLEKITRRICAYRIAQRDQVTTKERVYVKDVDYTPFLSMLPFALNASQTSALKRLEDVFCSSKKINSVLCGDVGSGKTVVAFAAVYFAVKNGYRAAVMAPTEILAKQHYNFIFPYFSKLGINVCFLSGGQKQSEKNMLKNLISSGFYDVVIGTHAVLHTGDDIPGLGFVVVDEQHRFGVAQRTALISKGKAVDVLTLSATPIPRSMQLVAYGEVEYITIERRHDSTVKTAIVPKEKRSDMWRYVAGICKEGQQAYVIAPKIFDAEGVESESVETLAEELSAYFEPDMIGVLHGKMKNEEKQRILDAFYTGNISVLVSTTVVEVGIDVPNASVIVVTDAEKFGLATLHQLRGRVGRRGQTAYCFLHTAKEPTEGLRTLCACSDGFAIAEKDFEMRGGGDVFGLEQSGAGTLFGLTPRMLKKAKEIADGTVLSDVEEMLKGEIEGFSLSDVSLT